MFKQLCVRACVRERVCRRYPESEMVTICYEKGKRERKKDPLSSFLLTHCESKSDYSAHRSFSLSHAERERERERERKERCCFQPSVPSVFPFFHPFSLILASTCIPFKRTQTRVPCEP